MTSISQALRTALLDFVWQGLAVAFLLWVALHLLRKRRAQARYMASCAALAMLAALPVATAWLAYRAPQAVVTKETVHAAATALPGTVTTRTEAAIGWLVRFEPWALPLWSAGVLFFSIRLVWGCWRVSAMRRRGRPAESAILATVAGLGVRLGLSRPVRVLTAALPDGPSVAGWLRPVLLLPPATVLGLTPEQLEAVLAHELAHIRRYDHLVNAAQTLVETLLFYHPAVWWTSACIREERELCCDDMAVRACGDAVCFARALTKLERLRVMAPAAALGSTGGPLLFRVQRLIGANHQECAPSKLSGFVAFALGLACLALNVHWAHGQERPSPGSIYLFATNSSHDGDAPGVTVDLGGAAVLHRTSVTYPETARNSGIQGTVAVQVTLDADGNVGDAHVVSGPMGLRKAVMSSVFEWHFTQATAGSTRAVNVTFQRAATDAAAAGEPDPPRESRTVTRIDGRTETLQTAPATEVVALAEDQRRLDEASRIERLRSQLEWERRNMASARETGSREQSQVAIRYLEAELRTVEGRSEERGGATEPHFFAAEREHDSLTGRTIKEINVIGLADDVKSDLLSRLPLRVGDTGSSSSMEAVGAAVRAFDEHLEWRVLLLEGGGAAIRINVPGSLRGWSIRK